MNQLLSFIGGVSLAVLGMFVVDLYTQWNKHEGR
jgi:hypothetical protein